MKTVGQLIAELQEFPPDMPVYEDTDYGYLVIPVARIETVHIGGPASEKETAHWAAETPRDTVLVMLRKSEDADPSEAVVF